MGAAMTCTICSEVIDTSHEHYALEIVRDPFRGDTMLSILDNPWKKRMIVCGRCWRRRRFLLWGEWFTVELGDDESRRRANPGTGRVNTTVASTETAQPAPASGGPATRHRLGESAGP